jgi:UDP-2,4-diacetamido-2,4,6-trideoxy-beta-L-altropyranose hydrolase
VTEARTASTVLVLRPATPADAARLLEWRNDPAVVGFSLTGRPVTATDHAEWLAARLGRSPSRLWIAEEGVDPVGQVRVDLEDGTGTVSIGVAREHRGRGLGSRMLRAVVVAMEPDVEVRNLRALVHPENVASMLAFEHVGFSDTGGRHQGFVEFARSVEANP